MLQLLGSIEATGSAGAAFDKYLPGLPFPAIVEYVRIVDQAGIATDATDYVTITATGAAARSTVATSIAADTTESLTLSGAVLASGQKLRLQVAHAGSGKNYALQVQWWGTTRNVIS